MKKSVILIFFLLPAVVLGQSQTCDEFDGTSINTSIWNAVSGSWSQSGGQLHGYWSLSAAHADQANLLCASSNGGDSVRRNRLLSAHLAHPSWRLGCPSLSQLMYAGGNHT